MIFVHFAHCLFEVSDYNAAITRKEDVFVKRTFKQIVHDLIEDGIYAYAMNLAVQRGDYEMLRAFEENIP